MVLPEPRKPVIIVMGIGAIVEVRRWRFNCDGAEELVMSSSMEGLGGMLRRFSYRRLSGCWGLLALPLAPLTSLVWSHGLLST